MLPARLQDHGLQAGSQCRNSLNGITQKRSIDVPQLIICLLSNVRRKEHVADGVNIRYLLLQQLLDLRARLCKIDAVHEIDPRICRDLGLIECERAVGGAGDFAEGVGAGVVAALVQEGPATDAGGTEDESMVWC